MENQKKNVYDEKTINKVIEIVDSWLKYEERNREFESKHKNRNKWRLAYTYARDGLACVIKDIKDLKESE